MRPDRFAVLFAGFAFGCGGAPEPQTPDADESAVAAAEETSEEAAETDAEPSETEEEEVAGLPSDCRPTSVDGICVPPKKFVDRLCQDVWPNVALKMFGQSDWTRGYLTRKTEAWNASGGASTNEELSFDEEVIVLRSRQPPKGGVQISGAGGYDVLRWDGSCVTLAMEELTLNKPPKPKTAKIDWRVIEPSVREALRKDDGVTETYRARKKECKGVTMGAVSKKCVQLTDKLSATIVAFVRDGGDVPEPEKLP